MEFVRDLGRYEWGFIISVAVLYLLYFVRMAIISRKIPVNFPLLFLKLGIRVLYISLILFAFRGPYVEGGSAKKEVKIEGKDIYLALDMSLSMQATDIGPVNRMERAKIELQKLVKEFYSDNIGLILFGTSAVLQSELTFDHTNLLEDIKNCDMNFIASPGTDLYEPLYLALEKHIKNEKTKSKAKIIILISDGEDFGEKTKEIAEEIKSYGIKLFTLGIGTEKGAKIPHRGRFKRDRSGQLVISKLKSNPLKELAEITKGSYFELSENKNDIPRLIKEIAKIKGQLLGSKMQSAPKDSKFHYFLLGAILLILFDILVSIKVVKI